MWQKKCNLHNVFKSLINDRKPTFKQASCKTQPASPPYYQFRKFFFSMKSITRIDFNNARISCKKVSIFELNSLFLLMITFAFCIHSLILQTRVLQRSKTKKNVISYKNKFLKWLSDNRAQKFFSMNSVYAHIKVLDQRGTCKESICLRKENLVFSVKTQDFAHPLMMVIKMMMMMVMKVTLVKEVMSCDVSPVAMFFL